MKWKWKRPAAFLLAAAMIFTMPGVPAFAVEAGVSAVHTGLCEHHPEHTEDCGYTEGTEGAACEHEHTEDCYTLVKKCVHEHDESCYPVLEGSVSENTATPSEAEKIEGCIRTSKTPKSTRYGRQNPLTELWNSEEQIFAWRKSWEMIINEEQERHGIVDRVDCRSHAARGLT